MFIGPQGSEEEKLINKISITERRMISARYDGKKRKFKRLKRKRDKLQTKYDIQFGGKKRSGVDKWKSFIRRTKPKVIKNDCDTCRKRKSMECPNSDLCYNTKDKPYYEKEEKK